MTRTIPTARCGRRAGGWSPTRPTRTARAGRCSAASPAIRQARITPTCRSAGRRGRRSRCAARGLGGPSSWRRLKPAAGTGLTRLGQRRIVSYSTFSPSPFPRRYAHMKLGRLLARLFIGGMFIGHGTQKLFGWFGGPGIEGTTATMDSLGLAPARHNAYAASLSETLGGAAIALGAFTPAAAALLIGTMTTAIRTVHLKNGFWLTGGGYEYNLTIVAALLLIVDG